MIEVFEMKSKKGYIGIDIAISVVVLFIFVSLIAILSYNMNSASKEIELKSEATSLAIEAIEQMKNIDFEEIKDRSEANDTSQYFPNDTTKELEEIEGKQGFYKRIIIKDYADENPGKIAGLVKKITVQIQYRFKGKNQEVEISTIVSKES